MKGFEIAGGSVPGTNHIKLGQPGWQNNHDAFDFASGEDYLVAVVCDGCGSIPHAEVGSKIGARLVIKHLVDLIKNEPTFTTSKFNDFTLYLKGALRDDLREFALRMGEKAELLVQQYFLFTIVGVVMARDFAVTFSFGDGVIAVNGQIKVILPAEGNAPPYVGQLLAPGLMNPKHLKFSVHNVLPLSSVNSVMIGTDGMNDFMKLEDCTFPGKEKKIGPLSQFWSESRYVQNPDAIRRTLALANLETIDESKTGYDRYRQGLLPDDTTLVVIQRTKEL